MLRSVVGYAFVCVALIGLPTIYHYRPPGTWLDRLDMITTGRFAHIAEPWFQIAMVVTALTGALGVILLVASRSVEKS